MVDGKPLTGTEVTFLPSPEIFKITHFEYKIIERRLRELSFLNSGVYLEFIDKREVDEISNILHYEGGLQEFVKYLDKWIPVSKHPMARKIQYTEPYLYCLNTTSKKILIDNHIFSDWDEIFEDDICSIQKNSNYTFYESKDIHKFLDAGFVGNTKIKLKNNIVKNINYICIGDIL